MTRDDNSGRRSSEGFGDSVGEGVAIGICVAFALAGALFAESTTSGLWFVATAVVLVSWPFAEGVVTRRIQERRGRTWFTAKGDSQAAVSEWLGAETLTAVRSRLELLEMELGYHDLHQYDPDDDADFALALRHAGSCITGTGAGRGGLIWDCNHSGSSFAVQLLDPEWEALSDRARDLLVPLRSASVRDVRVGGEGRGGP